MRAISAWQQLHSRSIQIRQQNTGGRVHNRNACNAQYQSPNTGRCVISRNACTVQHRPCSSRSNSSGGSSGSGGNGHLHLLTVPHMCRLERKSQRPARRTATRVLAAASPSEEDSIQTAPQTLTPLEIAPTVRLISVKKGKYLVEGTMVLDCTAQQVYDLLADYDRVGDIFTNILQSATTVGPDCDTTLDQICRWEFLVFSGKFEMKVSVAEQPAAHSLTFDLVHSPFMRTFQGKWRVEQQQEGGCRVHHLMAVTPTLAPPGPLAVYTKRVFERQVSKIMSDLATAMDESATIRQ